MPERIEIIVSADAADAAGALDDLADQIEEITGVRPEISMAADTEEAIAGIEQVGAAAEDTAAATAAMGEGASDSVGSIKGATRDMMRPLGLARSSVGDLNDAFQLMADTAIDNMGLTSKQVGQVATALPIIGVGIGLAVSAWGAYSDAQENAKKEADEAAEAARRQAAAFRDVSSALDANEFETAAEKLADVNKELTSDTAALGIPYQKVSDYITGVGDDVTALKVVMRHGFPEDPLGPVSEEAQDVAKRLGEARTAFRETTGAAGELGSEAEAWSSSINRYAGSVGGAAGEAERLAEAIRILNEELDAEETALDVATAVDNLETAYQDAWAAALQFGDGSEEAQDANRTLQGQLIDGKRSVLEYADSIGNIPEETMTEIRAMLARGDIAGAEAALNNVARDRETTITVRPRVMPGDFSSWGGGVGGGAQGFAAAPQAGTRGATASAMAVAPQVTIRIDARGAVDPYSVGRAVERAAESWGRVSGRWRPGLRSVS